MRIPSIFLAAAQTIKTCKAASIWLSFSSSLVAKKPPSAEKVNFEIVISPEISFAILTEKSDLKSFILIPGSVILKAKRLMRKGDKEFLQFTPRYTLIKIFDTEFIQF